LGPDTKIHIDTEFDMKNRSGSQIITALRLFLLFQILLLAGSTLVEARPEKTSSLQQVEPLRRDIGVLKIQTVLQSRLGDQKLTESAKSKVLLLDDRRIRLLSGLCDRVLLGGDTAGSDVAFLLLTMLIVLS